MSNLVAIDNASLLNFMVDSCSNNILLIVVLVLVVFPLLNF